MKDVNRSGKVSACATLLFSSSHSKKWLSDFIQIAQIKGENEKEGLVNIQSAFSWIK